MVARSPFVCNSFCAKKFVGTSKYRSSPFVRHEEVVFTVAAIGFLEGLGSHGHAAGPVSRQRALREQLALLEMPYGFSELRSVWVVSYHDDGFVEFAIQARQHREHILGRGGIQVSGRLIGQDQVGVGDYGAGDGYALFLTAGQLLGQVTHAIAEADQFQGRLGMLEAFFLRKIGQL
jgi:hypothetical protein